MIDMIDKGYFDDLDVYEIFGILAVFLTDKMDEATINSIVKDFSE